MKGRKSNFELLRIVAMALVIAMHYMTKGMHLQKLSVDASLGNHLWWLFYGFCLVSPNVYVMITGYFMCESWSENWDWKKYVTKGIDFWAQVLFYSWIIPIVLILCKVVSLDQLDFRTKITLLLPISEEHYWFATIYLLMYLISPIISLGLKQMSKVQLRTIIVAFAIVLSGIKSICPYQIPFDLYGNDILWFIELFLIAAYIRKYGLDFVKDMKTALLVYAGSALLVVLENYAVAVIVRKTGSLEYFMDMIYCSNHILVLVATTAFFCIFLYIGDRIEKYRISSLIRKAGAYSFGVYLLHENLVVRGLWVKWLGTDAVNGHWYQFFHMLLCICIMLVAGICVDIVRSGIFKLVKRK